VVRSGHAEPLLGPCRLTRPGSGTTLPQSDGSPVDTRPIITAEELRALPIARSAEPIALLSPGAVVGNGRFFGGEISFGGSSVAENAYYLNGYFSGNPITNVGGFTLPYGSIEQQETYTGGYGAKYGRSSGGVISHVGKSGSNDWHFGGQALFEPKSWKEERPDRFLPDLASTFPEGYEYATPENAGLAYDSGEDRKQWQNVYSGYVSGPIFKDRLFFFLSAEQTDGNEWSGAVVFDGKAYDGTMTLKSTNYMTLKGCSGILCQTYQLTRI